MSPASIPKVLLQAQGLQKPLIRLHYYRKHQKLRLQTLLPVFQVPWQTAYQLSLQPICPPLTSFSFQPLSTFAQLQCDIPEPAAQHRVFENSMNVSNKTLLQLGSARPSYSAQKSIFTGIGPLRDFFHELYLTLSITA